jgi:hypothetical protein
MPTFIRPARVDVHEGGGGVLIALVLVVVAGTVLASVLVSILVALAVAGLGVTTAGLAYLTAVLRRDGVWVGRGPEPPCAAAGDARMVLTAEATPTLSASRRLAIEGPRPDLADLKSLAAEHGYEVVRRED